MAQSKVGKALSAMWGSAEKKGLRASGQTAKQAWKQHHQIERSARRARKEIKIGKIERAAGKRMSMRNV